MNANKPIAFDFELKLDMEKMIKHLELYRYYVIPLVIFYLVAVFWGQSYMRNKPPWNVRPCLVIWDSTLAVLSLIGATRSWSSFFYIVREYGWYDTVCIYDHYFTEKVGSFWLAVFCASKTVELIDTAFIVVSKKPLTFLHWFHHATTAFNYWFFFPDMPSFTRYFSCINFTVHALMYAYFALSAMKIRLPRPVAMFITTFQIVQMFVNTFVAIYVTVAKLQGIRCEVTPVTLLFALGFFPFYIYMFIKFFRGAYINKTVAKRSSAKKETLSGKNAAGHPAAKKTT